MGFLAERGLNIQWLVNVLAHPQLIFLGKQGASQPAVTRRPAGCSCGELEFLSTLRNTYRSRQITCGSGSTNCSSELSAPHACISHQDRIRVTGIYF